MLFCFLPLQANEQAYLQLRIEGKEYDSLYLIIHTSTESHKIKGITEDRKNWFFCYPDSLHERHRDMRLRALENDSMVHTLGFHIPREGQDTLRVGSFSLSRQSSISAQFIRRLKDYNMPFFGFRNWIGDSFLVSFDDDKELSVSALALTKGYSMFGGGVHYYYQSYEEQLQRYIDMTIANPTSHFLIARVAGTLNNYNSIDDIKKIFSHFSDENRESYFGRRISRFINLTFFENFYLPTWDTNQIEPIIQDTTKYTLVVFSASWCAPCHRLVPILKKIYNDLSDYLNIVYISIDEQRTMQNWRNFMIEKEIPWRSLLAVDNIEEIGERYFVQAIPIVPHTLLVHPGGRMERLRLHEDSDVMRVYEVIHRKNAE